MLLEETFAFLYNFSHLLLWALGYGFGVDLSLVHRCLCKEAEYALGGLEIDNHEILFLEEDYVLTVGMPPCRTDGG